MRIKLEEYMSNMSQVSLQMAEIRQICEEEVDPTKNVKFKIQRLFRGGHVGFEQDSEKLEWQFK